MIDEEKKSELEEVILGELDNRKFAKQRTGRGFKFNSQTGQYEAL